MIITLTKVQLLRIRELTTKADSNTLITLKRGIKKILQDDFACKIKNKSLFVNGCEICLTTMTNECTNTAEITHLNIFGTSGEQIKYDLINPLFNRILKEGILYPCNSEELLEIKDALSNIHNNSNIFCITNFQIFYKMVSERIYRNNIK